MLSKDAKTAPLLLDIDTDTYLRRLVPNDAPTVVSAVRQHVDFIGRTQSWAYDIHEEVERDAITRVVRLAEQGQYAPYGLFREHQLMGGVALHSFAGNYAKLGYWRIDTPEVRGRGIVTRAARTVVNMGLGHMGLTAIGVEMRPDNVASRHVAERLGGWFMGVSKDGLLSYAITEPQTGV